MLGGGADAYWQKGTQTSSAARFLSERSDFVIGGQIADRP